MPQRLLSYSSFSHCFVSSLGFSEGGEMQARKSLPSSLSEVTREICTRENNCRERFEALMASSKETNLTDYAQRKISGNFITVYVLQCPQSKLHSGRIFKDCVHMNKILVSLKYLAASTKRVPAHKFKAEQFMTADFSWTLFPFFTPSYVCALQYVPFFCSIVYVCVTVCALYSVSHPPISGSISLCKRLPFWIDWEQKHEWLNKAWTFVCASWNWRLARGHWWPINYEFCNMLWELLYSSQHWSTY